MTSARLTRRDASEQEASAACDAAASVRADSPDLAAVPGPRRGQPTPQPSRLRRYVAIDANLPEHPRIDSLSDGAFRLYLTALLQARQHDGHRLIQADTITAARQQRPAQLAKHLAELTSRVLLTEADDGLAYHVHLPEPGRL